MHCVVNPRACAGYGTRRVCLSVCQLVCQFVCQFPAMAASNGHKSETTSSITTKRGIGMGSIAFSDVILLKSLSTKREAQKVTINGVIFTQKMWRQYC